MGARAWPLPYLIKPEPPMRVEVVLDPLPGARTLRDAVEGVGDLEIRLGGPTWDVNAGRVDSIRDVAPSLVTGVVSASAHDLPDYFLQEGLVFVSSRFREVCEPLIKDAEFLPAVFRTSFTGARSLGGGPEVGGYFWLNSWNRIDLVDLDRSIFAPANRGPGPLPGRPDQISKWKHLILKPALSADDHFFGVLQIRPEARYVSIELRNAVISAGLRVKFEPVLLESGPDYFKRYTPYSQQVNSNAPIPM